MGPTIAQRSTSFLEQKEYGNGWIVEAAYSTFKRGFGEFCMAKTMKNITKELVAKVFIYNVLINKQ